MWYCLNSLLHQMSGNSGKCTKITTKVCLTSDFVCPAVPKIFTSHGDIWEAATRNFFVMSSWKIVGTVNTFLWFIVSVLYLAIVCHVADQRETFLHTNVASVWWSIVIYMVQYAMHEKNRSLVIVRAQAISWFINSSICLFPSNRKTHSFSLFYCKFNKCGR